MKIKLLGLFNFYDLYSNLNVAFYYTYDLRFREFKLITILKITNKHTIIKRTYVNP